MKKTTREHDLELLDVSRQEAETEAGRVHRAALLEAVYEMSKDEHLERLRRELIDALRFGDLRKMVEVRKRVEDYVSSQTFRRNIAKKVARVSNEKEAISLYNRLGRR